MTGSKIWVGAVVLEGLMGGVSRAVCGLWSTNVHGQPATMGLQILEALRPPGWRSDDQSPRTSSTHKASGVDCPAFPLFVEINVHLHEPCSVGLRDSLEKFTVNRNGRLLGRSG